MFAERLDMTAVRTHIHASSKQERGSDTLFAPPFLFNDKMIVTYHPAATKLGCSDVSIEPISSLMSVMPWRAM